VVGSSDSLGLLAALQGGSQMLELVSYGLSLAGKVVGLAGDAASIMSFIKGYSVERDLQELTPGQSKILELLQVILHRPQENTIMLETAAPILTGADKFNDPIKTWQAAELLQGLATSPHDALTQSQRDKALLAYDNYFYPPILRLPMIEGQPVNFSHKIRVTNHWLHASWVFCLRGLQSHRLWSGGGRQVLQHAKWIANLGPVLKDPEQRLPWEDEALEKAERWSEDVKAVRAQVRKELNDHLTSELLRVGWFLYRQASHPLIPQCSQDAQNAGTLA
jgi:hypothetical protein